MFIILSAHAHVVLCFFCCFTLHTNLHWLGWIVSTHTLCILHLYTTHEYIKYIFLKNNANLHGFNILNLFLHVLLMFYQFNVLFCMYVYFHIWNLSSHFLSLEPTHIYIHCINFNVFTSTHTHTRTHTHTWCGQVWCLIQQWEQLHRRTASTQLI